MRLIIWEACHVMGQTPREVLRTILRWIESLIGVIFAFVRSGMVENERGPAAYVTAEAPSPGARPPYHPKSGSQACRGKSGPVSAEGPMSRNSRCTPRRTSMARSDWRLSIRGWRGIGEMIGMAATCGRLSGWQTWGDGLIRAPYAIAPYSSGCGLVLIRGGPMSCQLTSALNYKTAGLKSCALNAKV